MKTKTKRRTRGEPFVFLGRYWGPSCYDGLPDSCLDLPRILVKFHLTFSPQVDLFALLSSKCDAIEHNDSVTPIISGIARSIKRNIVCIFPKLALKRPSGYWGEYYTSCFPNHDVRWMDELFGEQAVVRETLYAWMAVSVTTEASLREWLAGFPTFSGEPGRPLLEAVVGGVLDPGTAAEEGTLESVGSTGVPPAC
jgi:hypothetical protein